MYPKSYYCPFGATNTNPGVATFRNVFKCISGKKKITMQLRLDTNVCIQVQEGVRTDNTKVKHPASSMYCLAVGSVEIGLPIFTQVSANSQFHRPHHFTAEQQAEIRFSLSTTNKQDLVPKSVKSLHYCLVRVYHQHVFKLGFTIQSAIKIFFQLLFPVKACKKKNIDFV